jgi:hypothetical protein
MDESLPRLGAPGSNAPGGPRRRKQGRGPHRSRRQPTPLPGLRCGARLARRASATPPRRPTPVVRRCFSPHGARALSEPLPSPPTRAELAHGTAGVEPCLHRCPPPLPQVPVGPTALLLSIRLLQNPDPNPPVFITSKPSASVMPHPNHRDRLLHPGSSGNPAT